MTDPNTLVASMHLRLIASFVLIASALVFIFQNIGVIEIRFLFWSIAMSRSLLLFLVLLIGIATGWLWHGLARRRVARRQAPGAGP